MANATLAACCTKPPSIRQACFGDYDQIARLETAVGLTPRPHKRWVDLWENNPAYHVTADWPIGWVLEDQDSRIVGSIGNIPLLYQLRGRTYLAASFVGWAVDPQYRAFSLMLVAHQLQHPQVDLHLVTTAGPMPQAVFTKLGWSRVPIGQWDQSALWVTSYGGALKGYLERKLPGFVSGAMGPLLRAPLLLTDCIRGRKRNVEVDCELGWGTDFDETFDEFWTELLEGNPSVFLAWRTRNTLKWHFQYFLERNEAWILTARKGPRLVGYAILQRKDSQSLGLTRMMLVDFQTLGQDRILSSAMMSCALDRCRRQNIHVLENLGCWLESLQPTGIRPSKHRALKSWCYLYKSSNKELATTLQTAALWYPTQFDGDASL
ncbi:MAG: hypothetical protein JWO19_1259 [Bryobacterales bacterium]|nr:hypothetical protein [Bryobacterales bacterium]